MKQPRKKQGKRRENQGQRNRREKIWTGKAKEGQRNSTEIDIGERKRL